VILLPHLPACDVSQALDPTDVDWLRHRMDEYARQPSTPGGTGVPTVPTPLFVPVVPPRRRPPIG